MGVVWVCLPQTFTAIMAFYFGGWHVWLVAFGVEILLVAAFFCRRGCRRSKCGAAVGEAIPSRRRKSSVALPTGVLDTPTAIRGSSPCIEDALLLRGRTYHTSSTARGGVLVSTDAVGVHGGGESDGEEPLQETRRRPAQRQTRSGSV